MTIIDVYYVNQHFNHIANTLIPGAWVAILSNNGYEIQQPFAEKGEFKDAAEAWKHAKEIF